MPLPTAEAQSCDATAAASGTCPFVNTLPPHVSTDTLWVILLSSAAFFAIIFFGSWRLFEKYWSTHFAPMHQPVKADSVARVGSTIHTLIVVPMLLYYLFTAEFDEVSMEPKKIAANEYPYALVQISFAITCGYFITDGILTYGFKMPLWQAFLAHHIFAATPYLTFLFVLPCAVGSFILAGFMVVETTNMTLNTQVLLERSGKSNSWMYAACLYTTIVLWAITRVYGPLRMIYTIHWHTLPALPDETKKCLYFNIGCAYFIVLFCAYGFVFVLLKEAMLRWKSNPEIGKVAPLDKDTTVLKPSPSMNISEDDVAVSANSPTHVSLYDAKKGIREVGDKIEDVFDSCLHKATNGSFGRKRNSNSNNHSDEDVATNTTTTNNKSKTMMKKRKNAGGDFDDETSSMDNELAPLNLGENRKNSNQKVDDRIHERIMSGIDDEYHDEDEENTNNNTSGSGSGSGSGSRGSGGDGRENSFDFENNNNNNSSSNNASPPSSPMRIAMASSSSLDSPPRSRGFKGSSSKKNSAEMRKRN